jgi:hypothetical protein
MRVPSIPRDFTLLAAFLALLAGCTFVAAGCGNLPLQTTATTPVVVTTPPADSGARTDMAKTRHERIMAEQKAGAGSRGLSLSPVGGADAAGSLRSASDSVGETPRPLGPTTLVLTKAQTPLQGVWQGTARDLAVFLLNTEPAPRFTVSAETLAEYYVRYAAEAGLRADLLWAQMIHETGYGMYGGDVDPAQNNFAGIGAIGNGATGVTFTSAEAGVMAHVAHMVSYVYESSPVSWANSGVDPRFDAVNPRGMVSVLADLDGRWAVPGVGYGEAVEDIARAINGG